MRICMLLHKSIEHDSRVRREAKALAQAGHDVTVVHLPRVAGELDGELDGFRVVSATPPPWVRRRIPFALYRLVFLVAFVRAVLRRRPDAVHAHDTALLVPGWIAARRAGARLVYDTHEYAPGVPYRERLWAWSVNLVERRLIGRCDAVICVSDGIADRLRERYRLRTRPTVVRNVPDVEASADGVAGLRERLGIGSAPLVLHQGALAPRRGCEALVEALIEAPDVHLVFLGDPWPGYDEDVQGRAREAAVADRVHFVPSVPVDQLLRHTREADIGVSLLSDDCENHRLALPNKVFEYIAAGVPVLVSDLPELRALVEEHRVGWTVDSADVPALTRALLEAATAKEAKGPALARAAKELRWSRERGRLVSLYADLDAGGAGGRRALVFVRNPVTHDARVLREGRLLEDLGYDTTLVGAVSASAPEREATVAGLRVIRLAPGRLPAVPSRNAVPGASAAGNGPPVPSPRRTVRRLLVTIDWYRRGIALLWRARPELVHCNDYNTMWIGVAAKLAGSRVIYDSHELWPDRNLRPEPRGWLLFNELLFLRVADETLTTSPGYADVMSRRYGVRPSLVRNIPDFEHDEEEAPSIEAATHVVYFGALTRNRGLETAIEALARLPHVTMSFVGPDAWGYRRILSDRARAAGVVDRLSIQDPVAPHRASSALRGAAVGLALIEPACLSYRLTLPNKVFEYVRAGLPVLASDAPVLADFVHAHGVGIAVSSSDVDAVVAALEQLLDGDCQRRCRGAAARLREELTWDREKEVLVAAYGGAGGDLAGSR